MRLLIFRRRGRLLLIGAVALVLAATAGIVVTSKATNTGTSASGRSDRMPNQINEPTSGARTDENDNEWKSKLTPEQYHVTREKGTEPPFSGKYWNQEAKGIYTCICCGTPLFDSKTKFKSKSGWPSFYEPIDEKKIDTEVDFSLFEQRTEVHCSKCKAHLGHVLAATAPRSMPNRTRSGLALGALVVRIAREYHFGRNHPMLDFRYNSRDNRDKCEPIALFDCMIDSLEFLRWRVTTKSGFASLRVTGAATSTASFTSWPKASRTGRQPKRNFTVSRAWMSRPPS
jgi:peptide-methionine (R)-S-oxide reductase